MKAGLTQVSYGLLADLLHLPYGVRQQQGGTMEIIATETSFATHEVDEWYAGLLTGVEEGEDYGFGPTIRFIIALDGEEGETWAMSSQKLSPRSKLYKWVQGIDAALIPEVGQAFQYQKLENRRVEVMFEQGENRENVAKIRAEKKTPGVARNDADTSKPSPMSRAPMQKRQAVAAAAKYQTDDESPF